MKEKKQFIYVLILLIIHLSCICTSVYAADTSDNAVDAADKESALIDEYGDVPVDEEHFPDAFFRNYLLNAKRAIDQYTMTDQKIDANGDGVLSTDERYAVTALMMETGRKTSLTDLSKGLEYFPNLSEIWAGTSNLSSINVSHNSNLTRLECGKTNLTSVDLSCNPNLFALDLENTRVTSVDVSENPDLYEIYVTNTPITELDVTMCPNLGHLRISGTGITSIDLSNNRKLAALYMNNCKIKNIDLSCNRNMYEIYCNGSALRALDISGMGGLNDVECRDTEIKTLNVEDCPNIRGIKCSNTCVTTLDLSDKAKLQRLEVAGTGIRKLEIRPESNPSLRYLDITNTSIANLSNLDLSDFSEMRDLYANNANLNSLKVPDGIEVIQCQNNHILELNLSGVESLTWDLPEHNFVFQKLSPQTRTCYSYTSGGYRKLNLKKLIGADLFNSGRVKLESSSKYKIDKSTGIVTISRTSGKSTIPVTYSYYTGYTHSENNPGTVEKMKVTINVKRTPYLTLNRTGTIRIKKGRKYCKLRVKSKISEDAVISRKSSRKSVATVSLTGVIRAKKRGLTTITYRTRLGGKASVRVRVY